MEELRRLRTTLALYQREHSLQVQLGFCGLYLLLQTFIIPGSLFLSILAGSLFGFYYGLFLVTVSTWTTFAWYY